MKNFLAYLAVVMMLNQPVFSQTGQDTASLGLSGDNLDLYAVLTLFQKSKTIEDFEKSLNEQKTGINNLDLDLDKKVDFIKVITEKKGESYAFILRMDVSKTESQDVAVILLDKDKNKKVTLQIVGDEALYGKDYVVEPSPTGSPSITANPAYAGPEPVIVNVPATTTVVVQSAPIVQYVYSPVYVPYYPPYHYGFPPPYFAAAAVIAVGIYRHNNYYYHGGYHGGHYGGHGNTVIIHNHNNYNNYNNNKMKSNTVTHNTAGGKYNNGNSPSNRASTRPSTTPSNRPSNGLSSSPRPSTTPSNRPSNGLASSQRPSTTPSNRPSNGISSSPRPSTTPSNRPSNGLSSSTRPSTSNYSSRPSMGGGRNMSSGSGSRARSGSGGRKR